MTTTAKTTYLSAFLLITMFLPQTSFAHCDSVAGPVAKDVQKALTSGELSTVLKWIRPADEPELRSAFERALSVRKNGGEAASLADQYFLETAVRLHRASESEPYTGLKPAFAAEERVPALVDAALKKGSVGSVEEPVIAQVRATLRSKIAELERTRKDADISPVAGRAYVRAYVELIHHVERLESSATAAEDHAHQ